MLAEKSFRCIRPDGSVSTAEQLPCWQDKFDAQKQVAQKKGDFSKAPIDIEEPELFMSLVVPAYNEEDRLGIMLTEAVDYLEKEYGGSKLEKLVNGQAKSGRNGNIGHSDSHTRQRAREARGWEVILVSDGSTDKTIETALSLARDLNNKISSSIRVVALEKNRGKGGAVTHGMRHVRGKYAVFADADGASKFGDLGKLVQGCQKIQDAEGRAVAVGSRAHLVGGESVVKVSLVLDSTRPSLTY